jgi:hypothetical protein
MLCGEAPPPTETSSDPCTPSNTLEVSCNKSTKDYENTTSSTANPPDPPAKHNNLIFSFAGGSIAVIGLLIVGFTGIKLYKAKFSRRRNFNYTLSAEDNGNIVGDENRVNC